MGMSTLLQYKVPFAANTFILKSDFGCRTCRCIGPFVQRGVTTFTQVKDPDASRAKMLGTTDLGHVF